MPTTSPRCWQQWIRVLGRQNRDSARAPTDFRNLPLHRGSAALPDLRDAQCRCSHPWLQMPPIRRTATGWPLSSGLPELVLEELDRPPARSANRRHGACEPQ